MTARGRYLWGIPVLAALIAGLNFAGTSADDGAAVPGRRLEEHAPSSLENVLRLPRERISELRDAALSETLERALLLEVLESSKPTPEQVREYFEKHRDRFVSPEGIDVWRILVPSESRANELLAQLKKSEAPQKTWSLLAREHSIDKATHFRKGHLGFVRADGTTDVPQVRVSRDVFAAAKSLADGAYTNAPVREGENWALLWRRGYRGEQRLPEREMRRQIDQQLGASRARATLKQLLASQRAAHLTEYHPELLEALPAPMDRGVAVHKRASTPQPAAGDPTPKKTDWGER